MVIKPHFEMREPRVQLQIGLNRTKGNTDLGADDAAE
jgi:hypothetical protein